MWIGRVMRGLLALLAACLPTALLWPLLIVTKYRQDDAWARAAGAPNPAKSPPWHLGIVDILVDVDPFFKGTIYLWLLPGAALLVGLGLWAAGVPVLSKERPTGWPVPRFLKVIAVALAVGAFLAMPWIYAWIRILYEPRPWLPESLR